MFESFFNTCWSRIFIAKANQTADTLSQYNRFLSNTYVLPAVLFLCQSHGPSSSFLLITVAPPLYQLLTCGTCSCLRLLRNTLLLCKTFGWFSYMGLVVTSALGPLSLSLIASAMGPLLL